MRKAGIVELYGTVFPVYKRLNLVVDTPEKFFIIPLQIPCPRQCPYVVDTWTDKFVITYLVKEYVDGRSSACREKPDCRDK